MAGIFRVGQRPKPGAAESGEKTLFARGTMNEDMTETGNRARKSLWQTGNHSGFSEIAGPTFP